MRKSILFCFHYCERCAVYEMTIAIRYENAASPYAKRNLGIIVIVS